MPPQLTLVALAPAYSAAMGDWEEELSAQAREQQSPMVLQMLDSLDASVVRQDSNATLNRKLWDTIAAHLIRGVRGKVSCRQVSEPRGPPPSEAMTPEESWAQAQEKQGPYKDSPKVVISEAEHSCGRTRLELLLDVS